MSISAFTTNPNGNLTLAETVTISARLHVRSNNLDVIFPQGGTPWYQSYLDYAVDSGIFDPEDYPALTAKATRARFVIIIAKAFSIDSFPVLNSVYWLPDLNGSEVYAPSVLQLYLAGVLAGSDDYGTFNPASSNKRSEITAIVSRLANNSFPEKNLYPQSRRARQHI